MGRRNTPFHAPGLQAAQGTADAPPEMSRDSLRETWRKHRRTVIGVAVLCAFFYALGYFSPRVASPLMCKIYG